MASCKRAVVQSHLAPPPSVKSNALLNRLAQDRDRDVIAIQALGCKNVAFNQLTKRLCCSGNELGKMQSNASLIGNTRNPADLAYLTANFSNEGLHPNSSGSSSTPCVTKISHPTRSTIVLTRRAMDAWLQSLSYNGIEFSSAKSA